MASAAEREAIAKKYDFYKLLGVEENVSASEIRKAYRRTALKYHPDKNTSASAVEKFHALSIASEVLLEPELRAEYDGKRTAKKREQERHAAFDLKRRRDKEELERREAQSTRERRGKRPRKTQMELRPSSWTDEREDALQATIARLQQQSAMLCAQRDAKILRERDRLRPSAAS